MQRLELVLQQVPDLGHASSTRGGTIIEHLELARRQRLRLRCELHVGPAYLHEHSRVIQWLSLGASASTILGTRLHVEGGPRERDEFKLQMDAQQRAQAAVGPVGVMLEARAAEGKVELL